MQRACASALRLAQAACAGELLVDKPMNVVAWPDLGENRFLSLQKQRNKTLTIWGLSL
jgi:hypothetical protein